MVKELRIGGLELILEYLPDYVSKKIINKLRSISKNSTLYGILKLGPDTVFTIYSKNNKEEKRLYVVYYPTYEVLEAKD